VSIKNGSMPRRFFTAAIVAALAFPAFAQGHDPTSVPTRDRMVPASDTVRMADGVPAAIQRALGGEVTLLPSGLYEVETARGYTYTTHGPDPKTDEAESPLTPGAPERAPRCIANPGTDHYQQVLYGFPADGANDLAAQRPSIQAQVRRNNALINRDSQASGGPEADFKVLCESDGTIEVSAFPVSGGSTASFSQVVSSAMSAGFTNDQVDYTIFYDGTSNTACGIGHISNDDQPGVNNANNNGGDYGMTYRGCWFGRTSIHENAHNEGAAQYSAPNSTGSGWHCNESNDILCYRDGGDRNQDYPVACPTGPPAGGGFYYDCNWNTYFDANPEPGEWLATHWNIGSTVNRFITFATATTPPETTIDSGVSGTTTNANPNFTFSANESGSTFECSLAAPGAPSFAPCTSPRSYGGLTDGAYEFQVRARDAALNVDPTPAVKRFTLDTRAPETRIDSGPGAAVNTTRVQFAFSADEGGVRFECSVDGGALSRCSSPLALDLSQGAHTFAVRSTDVAGHVDSSPATRAFEVDTVAPNTRLTSKPRGFLKSRKKPNLTIAFESTEPGSAFECRYDNGAFKHCGSPHVLRKVKFGRHSFEVRAVDRVANVDPAPVRFAFTVKRKR
jgi:hypothetical protein